MSYSIPAGIALLKGGLGRIGPTFLNQIGGVMIDSLTEYINGWRAGPSPILEASSPDFTFSDPNGPVPRENFPDYYEQFCRENGKRKIGKTLGQYVGDNLVVSCTWKAGTLEGIGLIVVGPEGVRSEVISFTSKEVDYFFE